MIINLRDNSERKQVVKNTVRFGYGRRIMILGVIFVLGLGQILGISAFEAHVINVVANVVNIQVHISPEGGEFCEDDSVEISLWSDNASSSIIYTLDGSDPACGVHGLPYVGPFMITETKTIKARACLDSHQSAIGEWLFEISGEYCDDECDIDPGDFCTQTIGGWGQECNGNNPGCMRDNNWDAVIGGSGLIVGAGYYMAFSGAEHIENYLPDSGPAGLLDDLHLNATTTVSGILGSQVTALKLNVLYSEAGVGLETPGDDLSLGYLEIASGPFSGMQVYYFLEIAEIVLGGDTIDLWFYGADIGDVVDTATSINENFVDCAVDNGFLVNPCCEMGSCCCCYEWPPYPPDGVVIGTEFSIVE